MANYVCYYTGCGKSSENDREIVIDGCGKYFRRLYDILIYFLDVRICQTSHLFYICKKCGLRGRSVSADDHVFNCYHNNICSTEVSRITLGRYGKRNILMNTFEIAGKIPRIMILKMDYGNIINNLPCFANIVNSLKNMKVLNFYFIDGETYENEGISEILFERDPKCVFCGMYYDCFPTHEICVTHLRRCTVITVADCFAFEPPYCVITPQRC